MKHWTHYIWGNEDYVNVVNGEIDTFLREEKFTKIIKNEFESKIIKKFENNNKAKEVLKDFLSDSERVFSIDNYTEEEDEEEYDEDDDLDEDEDDNSFFLNCDILIRENAILVIIDSDNSLALAYDTLLIEDMQLKSPKELSYLISKMFSNLLRSL